MVNGSGEHLLRPAKSPCGTCPYRRDVPSGVWEAAEYAKLPPYDAPTVLQPPRVFVCHETNERVCAGWAGCHNTDDLLALRLASTLWGMRAAEVVATQNYVSPVPLFGSGQEAADHGLAAVDKPDARARRTARNLCRKITIRRLTSVVSTVPAPATPADGDCLRWAPATALSLSQHGFTARLIQVAGWADGTRTMLAFVHQTVLVTHHEGELVMPHIVELTARQFNPSLPSRWIAAWDDYRAGLAEAAGVQLVTRWPAVGSDAEHSGCDAGPPG